MSKSSEHKILLIGPLPPVPSNAAQWTQLIAEKLSQQKIEFVVMIDELAPPPISQTVNTVRPFDPAFVNGEFYDWPRLVVVDGQTDSLARLAFLNSTPSPVLITDNSLFELARIKATMSRDSSGFEDWLNSYLGDHGKVLGHALFDLKRVSSQIGAEIPAYGSVISEACTGIGLVPRQCVDLESFCPAPTILPQAIDASKLSDFEPGGAAIVGLPEAAHSRFESICNLPEGATLKFEERFSHSVIQSIESANVVAVLDGHCAAMCPLVVRALSTNKKVVVANQRWRAELPCGSVLSVPGPQALEALAHALQFAITSQELSAVQAEILKDASTENTEFTNALLDVADRSTSTPLKTRSLKFGAPAQVAKLPAASSPSGAYALIGAIPLQPILEQLFPELDLDNCPRFLSLEHARYLAELTESPLLSICSQLGYEDVLVSDAKAPTDSLKQKTKSWEQISPHLLQVDKALAFGCSPTGAFKPTANASASGAAWEFSLPNDLPDSEEMSGQLDPKTGTHWQYDAYRNTISILFMTGNQGKLTLQFKSEQPVVMSDGTKTEIAGDGGSVHLMVPTHGMQLAKLAPMPQANGGTADIRKILAGVLLNLKWSPHA